MGVTVASCGIRNVKTRWGACNKATGRIWINLELAKKRPICREFIVVHEMVHLRERRHNDTFQRDADHFMPGWRQHRDELYAAPLSHEEWEY